jgi:hypothetical protein
MIAMGYHFVYPICIKHKKVDYYYLGIVEREGDNLSSCASHAEYKFKLEALLEHSTYIIGEDKEKVKAFTMNARMHVKERIANEAFSIKPTQASKQDVWANNFYP